MWTYVGQVDLEQDAAGKWRARVALSDNGTTSTYVLKFQTQPASADIDAAAAGLVSNKNERAALLEMRVVVGSDGFPRALRYQTKEEFAARFRAMYRQASREIVLRMAYWLIERINDGTFTDTQVRNAFNLSVGAYNAMKARATTMHDRYLQLLTATGE